MKILRKVISKSVGTVLTDELYEKLSASQQLIAALAEAAGIEVVIAEYENRNYVSTQTVLALAAFFSE